MQITVLHNQSLLDISVQTTGTADNWLKIAIANDLVPTDDLTPGQVLEVPEDLETNTDVVNYLSAKNIQPATAVGAYEQEGFKGIGEMVIGETFTIR